MRTPPPATQGEARATRDSGGGVPRTGKEHRVPGSCQGLGEAPGPSEGARPCPHLADFWPPTPAVSCISAFVTASRQPAPRPSLPSNRLLWSRTPGTGEPRAGEPEALLSPEAFSVLTRVPVFSASTKFPFFATPHSNGSAARGRIFFNRL